jgi:uncharacterized protein (TIGR00725 family)
LTRARQIAVIGGGGDDAREAELAEEVGRLLAEAGAVVVCGGLGGVMEAVARGAAQAGGDVIGIVPSDDPGDANPHCTHVVATATGVARNIAVVSSADAVIAIGGKWGTLTEIAHARRIGRPVIALDSWSVTPAVPIEVDEGIEDAADAAAAAAAALSFRRRAG